MPYCLYSPMAVGTAYKFGIPISTASDPPRPPVSWWNHVRMIASYNEAYHAGATGNAPVGRMAVWIAHLRLATIDPDVAALGLAALL